MKIIVGFPESRDRRSSEAKALGLRHQLELCDCAEGTIPGITRMLCQVISHSTITFTRQKMAWRSLHSWGGEPYETAVLHNYGAPVMLLQCLNTSGLTATFYRLDEHTLNSILDALETYGPNHIERGVFTVPESLRERLKRRLTIRW